MHSRTAHSCSLAREEGECDSRLARPQLPSPSGDPEIEETALLSSFWVPLTVRPVAGKKETKDSPPGPPPGEGVVRSPSPEEHPPPSPVARLRASCSYACHQVWRGPGRAGRLPCDRLHGAALLEAAAIAARERGRRQGAALGDE